MQLNRTEARGRDAGKILNAQAPFRGHDGFELPDDDANHLVILTGELGCESVRLGSLHSTGHRYRYQNALEDWVSMAVLNTGRLKAETRGGAFHAGAGEWIVVAPGKRDVCAEGAGRALFSSTRLLVSWSSLALHLQGLGLCAQGELRDLVLKPSAETAAIESVLTVLLQGRDESISRNEVLKFEARLVELTADLLLAAEAFAGVQGETSLSIERLRQAEEFMRSNGGDDILISDVARQLDTSVRSLQASFHKYRGISPYRYLEIVRLERARQRLLTIEPGEDVTTIALDCGLSHLGRFSGQYRARYGENPSVTARRSRQQQLVHQTLQTSR